MNWSTGRSRGRRAHCLESAAVASAKRVSRHPRMRRSTSSGSALRRSKWTRGRVYQRIVRACPTLEVLHLKSCLFWDLENISIDAPGSQITELVVDLQVRLHNPPLSTKA